jgi:eukaryotic-like serine/threonine-protein kinase
MATFTTVSGYRFGPFALDVRSGELTLNGSRIPLQEKPCSLLLALLEHPGDLVTRDELRLRLWPDDTFVGFEDGLNTAASKLREALGDDPQSPRYVETVRGRGYRLIGEVEPIASRSQPRSTSDFPPQPTADEPAQRSPALAAPWSMPRAYIRLAAWAALVVCIALAGAFGIWRWLTHGHAVLSSSNRDPVMIAEFENQTGEPRFNAALHTGLSAGLEQSDYVTVVSRSQTENALRLMEQPQDTRITAAVAREICRRQGIHALIVPEVTRNGSTLAVTAQLVDPYTGAGVRSYAADARDPDHLLDALDRIAVEIRRDLGESRLSIHQSHLPLPQVTTASLAALEDYSDAGYMFDRGEVQDAVRLYKAAIAADPGFAMAHAALGYLRYSFLLNEPAEGESEFRQALALSSRTTEREHAWIELRYAESQGRIDDAMRLYPAYVDRYPSDWVARFSYARLMRMHGHARDSLAIYEGLEHDDANDPALFVEEATAYKSLAVFPRAIAAYERAFSLDPHYLTVANINQEYGFTLVEDGEEPKAVQVLSLLLKDPGKVSDGERALAFLDLYNGHYASARKHLQSALTEARNPFSLARIHYMLAVVAEGEGDRREQVAELDRIAAGLDKIGPKIVYGALVGQAYARAGELAKARKLLDTLSPLVNERMEEQVVYSQILKAEVAAASGDYPTAIQFLRPPGPDDSDDSSVLVRESLGYIYQKMGNLDEAIDWLRKFADARSSHVLGWEPQQRLFDASFLLAQDYQQKGDRDAAKDALHPILTEWDHADPDLPLLKRTLHLRDTLNAHP